MSGNTWQPCRLSIVPARPGHNAAAECASSDEYSSPERDRRCESAPAHARGVSTAGIGDRPVVQACASRARGMVGSAVEAPDRPVLRFADRLLSKPTKQLRRRGRQDRCAVARGNNCHQSRRATLLTIRMTKRLWLDRVFRAIRWNTNNQPEVAFADKPVRLGWIPERGGLQMRLPAGPPRPPKYCNSCSLSPKIVRSQQGVRSIAARTSRCCTGLSGSGRMGAERMIARNSNTISDRSSRPVIA